MQFRKNLSTADRYFYHKKDYKNAYEYAADTWQNDSIQEFIEMYKKA